MTDFVAFAQAHGVLIENLYAGDCIRRCATEQNPRKKNGAYFWDGERGFCFAWDGEAKAQWYSDPAARPWSPAQKAEWQAKRRAMHAEHQRGQERAAVRAQGLMRSSVSAEHNYLALKGFPKAQGLITPDGALLIPMRNVLSNNVQGAQLVRWIEGERKYEKKMLFGMKAKEAVLRLGRPARETLLVEGYATGLSVHAAARRMSLNTTVMVTFSAGNLVTVAPLIRGAVLIYADNDVSGAGERAAKATGFPYCMSNVQGHDANDDHRRFGLLAVCERIVELRRFDSG